MKSKYLISAIAIISLSSVPLTFGQQGNDPQNVGQGAKEGAKSVGHGTAKGADKLGSETKEGAKDFKDKASDTGKDIKKGHVVSAGKDIGEGTGKTGREDRQRRGRIFLQYGKRCRSRGQKFRKRR